MRLVRAELLKLSTTRLLLWLALLILGFGVLVISLTAGQDSLDELARAGHQRDLVSFAGIAVLISAILGIVAAAGEWTHGTINHTLLVAPVRGRFVAAKTAAVAVTGVGLGLVALAVAFGLTAIWLAGRSVSIELASQGMLDLIVGVLVAAALAGAMGAGFGLILRRQTPGIVVMLLWLLIGEPLLGIGGVQRYAPGHALAAVVNAGRTSPELLHFWPGIAVSLIYTALFGAVGALIVQGSDIT
jgi:ABC-2 type transport system permease protein